MYKNEEVKGFKELEQSQIYVISELMSDVDFIKALIERYDIQLFSKIKDTECSVIDINIYTMSMVNLESIILIRVLLKDNKTDNMHNICVLYDRFSSSIYDYTSILDKVQLNRYGDVSLLVVLNEYDEDFDRHDNCNTLCKYFKIRNVKGKSEIFNAGSIRVSPEDDILVDFSYIMEDLYDKKQIRKLSLSIMRSKNFKCFDNILSYKEYYDANIEDYVSCFENRYAIAKYESIRSVLTDYLRERYGYNTPVTMRMKGEINYCEFEILMRRNKALNQIRSQLGTYWNDEEFLSKIKEDVEMRIQNCRKEYKDD